MEISNGREKGEGGERVGRGWREGGERVEEVGGKKYNPASDEDVMIILSSYGGRMKWRRGSGEGDG